MTDFTPKPTCSIEGCGGRRYANEMCRKHHERVRRVGSPELDELPGAEHPGERWRAVVGYEGRYEVSSEGRVRSLPSRTGSGRILKQTLREGYPKVSLSRDGKAKSFAVHRLVAFAFLGEPNGEAQMVLHSDGSQTNNSVENLRWGTASDNVQDAIRHGTYVSPNSLKTHCHKGHPLAGENLKIEPGKRVCLECRRAGNRERAKRYQRRKRAEARGHI